MTIRLPETLENSINAAVLSGRFASVDAAMTHAAHLLLRELAQESFRPAANIGVAPDPIVGLMRDDADLMDEIVADAYRQRREENWRELDLE